MPLINAPPERAREIAAAAADPTSRWNPGAAEQWWWLWLPLVCVVAIVATFQINEPFYRDWVLPEGYGVLELSQFFMALTGFFIALRLFFTPYVKQWTLLRTMVGLFAAACLFIAGEEHSWGQHFFHWSTPEYWSQINRQQETNLHNSFRVLNHLPQLVLEIAIYVGGILMPLWQRFVGRFTDPLLVLFAPSETMLPVALSALFFKIAKRVGNDDAARDIVTRPSEAMEVFFYMFILFYLIIFARRIAALASQQR